MEQTCRASETLGGPLKYSLAMGLITAVEWRTSVVGIIAVLQVRAHASGGVCVVS